MATIDLSKYGITGTTEIIRNPSYEFLFEEETKAGLEEKTIEYLLAYKYGEQLVKKLAEAMQK